MSEETQNGYFPPGDLRRAFVAGARWWEYKKTGATMWQSDREDAEKQAEIVYPNGRIAITQSEEWSIWKQKREQVNNLIRDLQDKPDALKLCYIKNAGGILNAYREGDLSFDEAVTALEKWAEVFVSA